MEKILYLLSLVAFISIAVLFQSCKEDTTTQPINHSPKIEILTSNPSNINTGEQTTLSCTASDEDGDNLSIDWTSHYGTFPNGPSGTPVIWQAPSTNGIFTVTATVSDGKLIDNDSVKINVGTTPQTPVLISPANNSVNLSLPVLLVWNTSQNTNSYTLQVSKDYFFTQVIFNQSLLTDTIQQINGLSTETQYYWRVSSTNNYETSDWSIVWLFLTTSISCPGLPTVYYEGKNYHTVQIGDQCWLKENMNIGNRINGTQNQIDNNILEKYCYDNIVANCNTYGGLYQWNEAMQYTTNERAQGICPSGWHIPTMAEFETLKSELNNNGNSLKAIGQGIGGGQGTDGSGFSALLAGYCTYQGVFLYLQDPDHASAYFWSSTAEANNAYILYLYSKESGIYINYYNKLNGFSVRCLKD